jgi:hypothetical protein
MSVSPPGHPAEGEGVEPAFPARGNRVSTAARPPVSGYLPFPAVETVGIEPTPVCLQDRLATLGTCAPDRSSCGGGIRTHVVRLMRPSWNRFSSPLRSDQGGSRTHKHQALDLTAMPVRAPGQSTISGDGGSRTHTGRLLRPLPLPVGLHHHVNRAVGAARWAVHALVVSRSNRRWARSRAASWSSVSDPPTTRITHPSSHPPSSSRSLTMRPCASCRPP